MAMIRQCLGLDVLSDESQPTRAKTSKRNTWKKICNDAARIYCSQGEGVEKR